MKITPPQRGIILSLYAAHVAGFTEVSLANLASELSRPPEEIRREVRALILSSLCDRMDSEDVASLSASGLRFARSLEDSTAESTADQRSSREISSVQFEDSERFLSVLRFATQRWTDVVAGSNIGREERTRLQALGSELFSHPAFFEFIRRALPSNGLNDGEKR